MFTDQQIQYIDTFCKAKGVKYRDIRMELVDHFTEAMSLQLREQPGISFEEALDKAYISFGGEKSFKNIVAAKVEGAAVYVRQVFRQYLWHKFMSEKLLIAFIIAVASFAVLNMKSIHTTGPARAEMISLLYLLPVFSVTVLQWIAAGRDKKWVFLHSITKIDVSFFLLYYLPAKGLSALIEYNLGPAALWFSMLTLLVIYLVLRLHAYCKLYRDILKRYKEEYPQLFSR